MSLDLQASDAQRGVMRVTAIVTVGVLTLTALFLVAFGTPAADVREVLTIAIPALTALAAHSSVSRRR